MWFLSHADHEEIFQKCFLSMRKSVKTNTQSRKTGKIIPLEPLIVNPYLMLCEIKLLNRSSIKKNRTATLPHQPHLLFFKRNVGKKRNKEKETKRKVKTNIKREVEYQPERKPKIIIRRMGIKNKTPAILINWAAIFVFIGKADSWLFISNVLRDSIYINVFLKCLS